MINPTCGSCVFRVSSGKRLPRVCQHDGLSAVGGHPCRMGKWSPRSPRRDLPFSDRLRRSPEMRSELL